MLTFGLLTELSPSSVFVTAPFAISGPLTEFVAQVEEATSVLSRISSPSIAFAATSDPLTASVAISPDATEAKPRSAALTVAVEDLRAVDRVGRGPVADSLRIFGA